MQESDGQKQDRRLDALSDRANKSGDIGVSMLVMTEVMIEAVRAIRDVSDRIDAAIEEQGRWMR